MKRIFRLSFLAAIFGIAISDIANAQVEPNIQQERQYGDVPQTIIVAGKIDNHDQSQQLTLDVNRIGFMQEQILAKIDSAGNFIAIFESYIPVDVWVSYRTNFLVLLHPGDSLFVHFDGQKGNRPALLNSISFGGDAAQTNQYAAKFQQMYYFNELYRNVDRHNRAVKENEPAQYLLYMDTIQQKFMEIYDQFIVEHNPNDESKKWARLYIENDYYRKLSQYASNHKRANNMEWDNPWDVPKGFYDVLCNRLPIDSSMFINAEGLFSFHNSFEHRYVFEKLIDRKTDGVRHMPGGRYVVLTKHNLDSLKIFSIIEFVPDPLLLQIILTAKFSMELEFGQNIRNYEKFHDVVDKYIKEPFLKEPLHQKYLQTKHRIENPQVYTEAILKEAANLSVSKIMDDILQQNKGKVIYVDFWGTWCGPCLMEMPNSKIIEHKFKDKDVVCLYICLESEEKQWKATLDQFQLGGQHYLLSRQQSGEMRKLFEITGVPFYMLIDKNGVIKEKGSHLRPLFVQDKIKEMLK